MAFDSINLYHLIRELEPVLVGTRIDRIHQPEKEEVHIVLRSAGKTQRLLLNAGSTAARIHLTGENKKNPVSPPMFCMILRKHLESGKITEIRQQGLERIVTLTVQNYNDRGDLQDYHLHLEIMGKHSNLILVDPQTNAVLDGIRRYSHLVSRHREILPGRTYIAPPNQNKSEALFDEDAWTGALLAQNLDLRITDALIITFNGISPELAKEIVVRAALHPQAVLDDCGGIDLSRLYQAYILFFKDKDVTELKPTLYYPSGRASLPVAFSFMPYEQYAGFRSEEFDSLNEAVDTFFTRKYLNNVMEAKRGSLRRVTHDHYQHLSKKQLIYEDTIAKAQKGLSYQKLGELLTANIYKLTLGLKEVTVDDYTDPEYKPLTIGLDPLLSGIDNAQRYYKLYNKAKATIQKTQPLLDSAVHETAYLQSLFLSIDQAAENEELEEIHQELVEQGYVSGRSGDRHGGKNGRQSSERNGKHSSKNSAPAKHAKQQLSAPHLYLSSTGQPIIVGRNNKQNDRMTWREAKPGDMWLHVKNIPGSHVIVPLTEDQEFPDDETLLDAAALAVYFSQARDSSQVPVDYTHVRHIKKPRGAKPGMVVYDQNWSLLLTPKTEDIERLLSSEQTVH